MNIFQIPANDQSVYFLGQIFGYVGNVLPVTGTSLLLGTMFKTFNTVALTVGVLVVVYTTVVGLLATAHEGEFMGKKWSGLWVPIRTLLGIAALFPTATGYSALQVIMMWIVLQGIGAADSLWSTTLNYMQVAGSPFAGIAGSTLQPITVKQSMNTLFQGLVCQATSSAKNKNNIFSYCKWKPNDPFCQKSYDDLLTLTGSQSGANNQIYNMGPGGACGTVTFGDQSKVCAAGSTDPQLMLKCQAYKAQQQILQSIITTLGGIAGSLADYDTTYMIFYYNTDQKPSPWLSRYCADNNISNDKCCVNTKYDVEKAQATLMGGSAVHVSSCSPQSAWLDPSLVRQDKSIDPTNAGTPLIKNIIWPYAFSNLGGSNFIQTASDYYVAGITGAITGAIGQMAPTILTDWRKTAQSAGWITAGGYYYDMAKMGGSTLDQAVPTFGVSGGSEYPKAPILNSYRHNYAAAQTLIDQATPPSTSSFGASMPSAMSTMTDSISSTGKSLMSNWMNSMTGSGGQTGSTNPLAELQSFGHSLIAMGEALFAIFLVTMTIIVATGNISVFALGSGVLPGWGAGLMMAALILMPLVFALISALYVLGGTLAVYAPLIPYIIFTMAAIGWVIGVIETMIAAPLVALGMLSPGGQHEIFGRAEPAIMLLLNVFLRPSLMLFGLMAAMLFATVSVNIVNMTFQRVLVNILGSAPTVTEILLFVAAYTFLIISVLNKCFALIHLIPERVMTWIGGQAVSYGEGEALGEVKRGTEGAGGGMAGAGKGGLSDAAGKAGGEASQRGTGGLAVKKGAEVSRKNPLGRDRDAV